MKPKEQAAELASRIRVAAKQGEPIARAVIALVKHYEDEAKASLVVVDGDDMLRVQGAARQLQRIYRELTVEPPTIRNPGVTE